MITISGLWQGLDLPLGGQTWGLSTQLRQLSLLQVQAEEKSNVHSRLRAYVLNLSNTL
jgi:hypothetical protein